MNPDYTKPPEHYQVMTIEQARQEYPDDCVFTIKDYCEIWGLEDGHWCYVRWCKSLEDQPRKPSVIAFTTMDKKFPGRFGTYLAACRMAWYTHLQAEMLGCNVDIPEIDRLVAKFQTEGRL